MKLGTDHVPLTYDRGEHIAVLAGREHRSIGEPGRMVAVDVVEEIGLLEHGPKHPVGAPGRSRFDTGPADMGNRQIDLEAGCAAWEESESGEARRLFAGLEEQLKAKTDPHDRTTRCRCFANGR